jgi:flagellar basal-body rod modification protein FlgD
LSGAKTDEDFFKMLEDNINRENKRVPSNKLDKDAFLKLFVTQIQYQDPLNPDDSSEMAAQLAQFDGLEQMMNVNKTLEKMNADNQTSRAVGLVDFVGKEVTINGGKLRLDQGKVTDATFSLAKDSSKTVLEVRNSAGIVVDEQDLGQVRAGEHKVEWDGKTKDGKTVPDGAYTMTVVAKDMQEQAIPADITSSVKISGVDLQDKGGSFYTDIGKVRVDEISSVGKAGFKIRAAETDLSAVNKDLAKQAAVGVPKVKAETDKDSADQPSAETIEEAMKAAAAHFGSQAQLGAQAAPQTAPPAAQPVEAVAGRGVIEVPVPQPPQA